MDLRLHENRSDYFCESSLSNTLTAMFPYSTITPQRTLKIRGELGVKRIDYSVVIDGVETLVEYDGDAHYRTTSRQKRDEVVRMWCELNGIRFIQIPYWIQPTDEVLSYLFGLDVKMPLELRTTFPHGFVSRKCILPADFNAAGVARFITEIHGLTDAGLTGVVEDVIFTLDHRIRDTVYELENHPVYKAKVSDPEDYALRLVVGRDPRVIELVTK